MLARLLVCCESFLHITMWRSQVQSVCVSEILAESQTE